jgi:hypothetical protein
MYTHPPPLELRPIRVKIIPHSSFMYTHPMPVELKQRRVKIIPYTSSMFITKKLGLKNILKINLFEV